MYTMALPQFLGPPCGHYGTYTFHKGFKYFKHGKYRTLNLGDFFFVRISANHDPCIGELELLWNDDNNDQRLSSLRLYFLPEQTPEGRHSVHGEDEVLAASDKVVLRLDDLVSWITDQVEWNHGLLAFWSEKAELVETDKEPTTPPSFSDISTEDDQEKRPNSEMTNGVVENGDEPEELSQEEEAQESIKEKSPEEDANPNTECTDSDTTNNAPAEPDDDKDLASPPTENEEDIVDKDELKVMVLSYPSYCRYRTITKRLDGMADKWMMHSLVVALGGFSSLGRNTHMLFCRDMFDHEELANHELNCEYLAPTLKMKRRKKKGKTARSNSPGSDSNTSEENKESPLKIDVSDNFKQPPCKTEQEFLQRLYKFMKKRKTPIHRVPHLGFKQIDMFVFYSFAQKLGGYDKITTKRLWKHVYDVLGGDPGSTSAATCTRRHYERLLLPFERFMDGKEYKPKQSRKQAKPQKKIKDENENDLSEKSNATVVKSENEDAYAFTDSNHENSKDSLLNEEIQSGDEAHSQENYSDEDSKSIWSIQRSLDGKEEELEKNGNKSIKPLIIQKEQNESFSEKERKWNEIRRKNALARKWVRQLRPSRGGKMSVSEKGHCSESDVCSSEPKLSQNMTDITIKSEPKDNATCSSEATKAVLPASNSQPIKQEPLDPVTMEHSHPSEKFKQIPIHGESRRLDYKKGSYYAAATDAYLASRNNHLQPKPEAYGDKKSWSGYSRDGMYQIAPAPERYPYPGFDMSMIHTFYKHGRPSENGPSKAHTLSNNSSESIGVSASELESSSMDGKMNPSQRRPSVIQHTEHVASPCQSPKMGSEGYPESFSRDMQLSISPNNDKITAMLSSNLAHTMTGKVTEWLAKGVPEAVACKTPYTTSEKAGELHDRVLMPSSCKTPGPGSGKVPMYVSKNKNELYAYPGSSKAVRDKGNYRQVPHEAVKRSSGYISNMAAKLNPAGPKAFHPTLAAVNSPNPVMKTGVKPEQLFPVNSRNKLYGCEPVYCPPKRHKLNPAQMPTPLPPRPSLLSFTRQQTYRTSPLSDIPKAASTEQNDYSSFVLDLSVKKKSERAPPIYSPALSHSIVDQSPDGCLDLSVKRRPSGFTQDKAIENITPPLPTSSKIPHHPASSSSRPLKPLPTLIALQDLIREEASRQRPSNKPAAVGSSSQPTIPISSSVMPSNSLMYAASAQGKMPQNFMPPLPEAAFSKEMAKSLFRGPDPTQFSPYVIPPFYTASWAANSKLPTVAQSSNSSAAASPNSMKEVLNPTVFPKQYMYNLKHQFPLICKDNGYYPPSCK